MTKFKDLITELQIDETFTKPVRKTKIKFDSVKASTVKLPDMNYMADVLFMPETKKKIKYLLVVVDLGTDEFDIEPMLKLNSSMVLSAIQRIFKRDILKKPEASIRTDGASEFQGDFAKYCYNNNIILRVAESGRHKQLANVDSLMVQLERLFNGYMNKRTEEDGLIYSEWTDIIDWVREKLNAVRKKPSVDPFVEPIPKTIDETNSTPKFNEGDWVYRLNDKAKNALGDNHLTEKFRVGDYRWDIKQRKIKRVLPYPNNWRYILDGLDHVSFVEQELRPAPEPEPDFDEQGNRIYYIKRIIERKRDGNSFKYKIWWRGLTRAKATWASRQDLVDDGFGAFIDNYDDNYNEHN